MENEIVQHVKFMEGMLFGFSRIQLRRLAIEYAKVNGIQSTFNDEKKEAGVHWLNDFMARHKDELSLRTPEATSTACARGFNAVSVGKFFTLLEQLQALHSFIPDRIYNVDETSVSTSCSQPTISNNRYKRKKASRCLVIGRAWPTSHG